MYASNNKRKREDEELKENKKARTDQPEEVFPPEVLDHIQSFAPYAMGKTCRSLNANVKKHLSWHFALRDEDIIVSLGDASWLIDFSDDRWDADNIVIATKKKGQPIREHDEWAIFVCPWRSETKIAGALADAYFPSPTRNGYGWKLDHVSIRRSVTPDNGIYWVDDHIIITHNTDEEDVFTWSPYCDDEPATLWNDQQEISLESGAFDAQLVKWKNNPLEHATTMALCKNLQTAETDILTVLKEPEIEKRPNLGYPLHLSILPNENWTCSPLFKNTVALHDDADKNYRREATIIHYGTLAQFTLVSHTNDPAENDVVLEEGSESVEYDM